jgi:hypothetical protein
MGTLKDHQDAMVELLAHGTAIPASATRLAHALHDVLAVLNDKPVATEAHTERRSEATTSGLNDAMLAYDLAAVKPKQQSLESLLKQRDNTIRQLKARVAEVVGERDWLKQRLEEALALINESTAESFSVEQAGCRKEDTEALGDGWIDWAGGHRDDWPVAGETFVDVKLRNGHITHGFCAQVHHWDHRALESDIIAYRIAGESK